MIPPQILALLAPNRQKGTFALAIGQGEATLRLWDFIVDSQIEAEWFGGICPAQIADALASLPNVATLHIRIDSPGGSVFAARHICQLLRDYRDQTGAKLVAHIDGLAASAASLIPQVADERRIAPGAFIMIHNAWSCAAGNADQHRKCADLLDQVDATIVQTYAGRSKLTPEAAAAAMAAETWYDPEAAMEAGFVEFIEPEFPEQEPDPTDPNEPQEPPEPDETENGQGRPGNHLRRPTPWNLTAYRNPPKDYATQQPPPPPTKPPTEPTTTPNQTPEAAAARARALAVRLRTGPQ